MLEELIDRLKPKLRGAPLLRSLSEEDLAHRYHDFQLMRLRAERLSGSLFHGRNRLRVAATACWGFPIYSQTFVYQELAQLIRQNFDLRFLYSSLNPRDHLPAQFSALWPAKRKLVVHQKVYERDYAYYRERIPEKIEGLVDMVCRASGMPPEELRNHHHFRQAFSFTRMVEAFRPDYLHGYFFYEGTLFTLFASHLLDIPRGVSCYADHVLDDYALKMVPLHLEQCSIVVATSHRIKRELRNIAPHVDPAKIIVKPNAINAARFPPVERKGPPDGAPYRLVCVSRIEPKKGIIYLVEAVRRLLDRKINVSVHILGGVDQNASSQKCAAEVEARIRELDLGGVFHLEGRKNEAEIRRFLEEAHLFVAPFIETDTGDKDGIPTALLEAMSSGLPAVATDAGSITEVIDDGRDGRIVRQRDPAALSGVIEELLLQPTLRQRLGYEAAIKIRQYFDVEDCERRFHDRIRKVSDGPPVTPLEERLETVWKERFADLPIDCGAECSAGCCRRHLIGRMSELAARAGTKTELLSDREAGAFPFEDWAALGGAFGLKATRVSDREYAISGPDTLVPIAVRDVRKNWQLRVAEGNSAAMAIQPDAVRVVIEKAGTGASWDVQLNVPAPELKLNQKYVLHFRARSDSPKKVFAGVAQAHEPWSGLGLYEEIELSEDWQEFQKEFIATADDDQARIHFDFGACAIAVEIARAALSAGKTSTPNMYTGSTSYS